MASSLLIGNKSASAASRFLISRLPRSRLQEALDLSEKYFLPYVTLYNTFNLLSPSGNALFRRWLSMEFEHGGTFIAEDRLRNNKLVGVIVGLPYDPSIKQWWKSSITQRATTEPNWNRLCRAWHCIWQGQSIADIAGSTTVYDQHICAIPPEYVGTGLAGLLISSSVEEGIRRGYQTQFAVSKNEAGYQIITKLGFRVHREVTLKNLVLDGQAVIPFGNNANVKIRLMVRSSDTTT